MHPSEGFKKCSEVVWYVKLLLLLTKAYLTVETATVILQTQRNEHPLFSIRVQVDEIAVHRATIQSYFHNLSHQQLGDCWESDSRHGILLDRKQLFFPHP